MLASASMLVEKLASYPFSDVETALLRLILDSHKVRNVRNTLIRSLASRVNATVRQVEFIVSCEKVNLDLSLLEKFYELRVEGDDRKINGAYYTPTHIVSHIIEITMTGAGTVCDPACGSGAFLVQAARTLKKKTELSYAQIFAKMLYGVDILETNVAHVTVILSLLAIIEGEDMKCYSFNIFAGDSLDFEWKKKLTGFSGFDYVIGNPPYVRTKNLRPTVRANIRKWMTGRFGNSDLYIPFFELALHWTNEKGRVGFITPSTYLTSYNASLLRLFFSANKYVEKIIDFNGWQIFEGAMTYTCITVLGKKASESIKFTLVDDLLKVNKLDSLEFTDIPTAKLSSDAWRLLSRKDAEKILKIENAGSPLHKYVRRFVTGIATLRNDLYVLEDNGKKLLVKEVNGKKFLIERSITKKIIKPNRVKDAIALEKNRERVIYPYHFENGRAHIMGEDEIRTNYPNAYAYFRAFKTELLARDKGAKKYPAWYAYGRGQGLDTFGKKIILPMMGSKPTFVLADEEESLIYCGYAIFAKKDEDYPLLQKVLNSKVMWYYIKKTSKNYSGGFKSFAKNYVKNFSIPEFTAHERLRLLRETSPQKIDEILFQKYQIA